MSAVAETRPRREPVDPEALLITTDVAARRLGVSTCTVQRLAHRGRLPFVRFGPYGQLRFRPEDVEALATPTPGRGPASAGVDSDASERPVTSGAGLPESEAA